MDQLLKSLPDDLFNALKCYICDKYLSVGPVISVSETGKPYKCGRCKNIPSIKEIRNLCYENVAEYLLFPCSYESCKAKLMWQQVEEHEKFCQHRNLQCVANGCEVLLRIEDFEQHFKTHDKRKYFENCIQNYVGKKHTNTVLMLKCLEDIFFVVIRYSFVSIHIGVFSLQSVLQSTLFHLTISSASSSSPSISYKAEVIEYNELIHCMNCMRNKCQLNYHQYSIHYQNAGKNISKLPIEINMGALETILKHPGRFVYSVNILYTSIDTIITHSSSNSNSTSEKSDGYFNVSSLGETEQFQ